MESLKELKFELEITFILTWIFMFGMFFSTLYCMKYSENILKEQNQQIIELLQNKE